MDEELHRVIGKAKQGDKVAFAELVKRFKGHIYRHAYGMLGDQMEAEDASQEAFIKAFYSISRLESEYSFTSWMIRIVSNLCMDRLKKRGKEHFLPGTATEDAQSKSVQDTHLKLDIEDAMKKLTREHREVILLHDVQGYRYEEMAEMLDIPLGTVKSRLNAARLALRNEWRKGDE